MRVGDFSTGIGHLSESVDNLQNSWQNTRELWNDRTSQSFEETHLQQLLQEVTAVLQATTRMSEVVLRARRECEDENR
jgi:hypothetical protein